MPVDRGVRPQQGARPSRNAGAAQGGDGVADQARDSVVAITAHEEANDHLLVQIAATAPAGYPVFIG
ncbi:hypothetical protein [Sinomonas sp. ASV322]|uniref:hypothetical protein n=1 Tax=Sinomonas sp. ASV322 TaxID=3041920 RepID=UPI0027DE387C|nr:hypothetical protein [Sinomonas sp. ASV322]MDQ4503063.1 hypothetical protein [Sinomonas sp. ASV322]